MSRSGKNYDQWTTAYTLLPPKTKCNVLSFLTINTHEPVPPLTEVYISTQPPQWHSLSLSLFMLLTAMHALLQNLPSCSPSDRSNTIGAARRQEGSELPQPGHPHVPSASLLSITMSCRCDGRNHTTHSRKTASVTTPSSRRADCSSNICACVRLDWRRGSVIVSGWIERCMCHTRRRRRQPLQNKKREALPLQP